MSLAFEEYQRMAYSTAGTHDSHIEEVINWCLGIGGEAGEILDTIKKHAYHGHELSVPEISKELGDLLWYLTALCTVLGLELEEVAAQNLTKLAKRYPSGFTHFDSINRSEP